MPLVSIGSRSVTAHLITFGLKLAFAYLVYLNLATNILVNHMDGIWQGFYMLSGNWERSLGRWALPYCNQLYFGNIAVPFNALITLAIFLLGTELIIDSLALRTQCCTNAVHYLFSGLFITSTLVCVALSYAFMAIPYAVTFLCFACCAWSTVRSLASVQDEPTSRFRMRNVMRSNSGCWLLLGMISLTLGMALYQGYIGCVPLIITATLQLMLVQDRAWSQIWFYLRNSLLVAIGGMLLYQGLTTLILKLYGVTLASYMGCNTISLGSILHHLIPNLIKAYQEFGKYLCGSNYHNNMFEGPALIAAVLLLIACFVFAGLLPLWRKATVKTSCTAKYKYKVLLAIALYAGYPLFCNVSLLLAPTAPLSVQQTAPLALLLPLLLAVALATLEFVNSPVATACPRSHTTTARAGCLLAALLLLWGNIYSVQRDQEALRQGINAASSLAHNILQTLTDKGYYPPRSGYHFLTIGVPAKNPMFYKSHLYHHANAYAQFGNFTWSAICNLWSWQGIFKNLLGVAMPIIPNPKKTVEPMLQRVEVRAMPAYPQEGSILLLDQLVVVKVS